MGHKTFKFKVHHVQGKLNSIADYLSRNPVRDCSKIPCNNVILAPFVTGLPQLFSDFHSFHQEDAAIQKILKQINPKQTTKFKIVNGKQLTGQGKTRY